MHPEDDDHTFAFPDDAPKDLLAWYDRQKRDLPWRRRDDPYAIWISETMLQQTRVATVKPYFEAFLEAFPTVSHLAEASLDQVLARWSGLGYYRRARMLHAAAQKLRDGGRDELPSSSAELLELPGIGPYTAAAVASIAFGEVIPVLDGNVERVLCRLGAYGEDPKKSGPRRKLLAAAGRLLDPERPGDSNQAMMELGATVCGPRAPKCLLCPLASFCRGRSNPEAFPRPKAKKKLQQVALSVALVEREDGRVLMFRRPEKSTLLAGMWELPHVTHEGDLDVADPAGLERRLGETYGGRFRLGEAERVLKHGITFRAISLHVHRAELVSPGDSEVRQRSLEAAWVAREDREHFAVSSAVHKVLRSVAGWP